MSEVIGNSIFQLGPLFIGARARTRKDQRSLRENNCEKTYCFLSLFLGATTSWWAYTLYTEAWYASKTGFER